MTEQRLKRRRKRRERENEMIIDIPEEELLACLTELQDAIQEGDGAGAQLKVAALASTLEEHTQEGT